MSDEEFMMEEGDDFEYEDDDEQEEEGDTDLENTYYTAKSLKEDDPDAAIKKFEALLEQEQEKGDWGFKALKQLTKLTFRLQRFEDSLRYYTRLLPYTKTAVTRNYAEKSINSILDYVSASSELDTALMQKFYDSTNVSLAEAKNERLSMKTNLKLAKLWLDRKEYTLLQRILADLRATIRPEDPNAEEVDNQRGTLLLEILAMEIQMYTETKNNKKLREIYDQTLQVKSAIPHPRIMGVIRECGGKMHMSEREWAKALNDFFEAFKNYDEAGSPQRTQVLKYLVLANMLMGSEVDPFDSQETKPYKNDRQIQAMTALVAAYQRREVHEAEKIIRENRSTIMDDPFIREHIDAVLRSLRTQWILDIIKPYSRIEVSYLARQLSISIDEVEDILVSQILDGKIRGQIDQVSGKLELDNQNAVDSKRYASLAKWSDSLSKLQSSVLAKAAQSGPGAAAGPGPGGMSVSSSAMGMSMPMGMGGMGGFGIAAGGGGGYGGAAGVADMPGYGVGW